MSEITREGYIKLAIMSTDVEKKKEKKRQNIKWAIDLRFKEKKKK